MATPFLSRAVTGSRLPQLDMLPRPTVHANYPSHNAHPDEALGRFQSTSHTKTIPNIVTGGWRLLRVSLPRQKNHGKPWEFRENPRKPWKSQEGRQRQLPAYYKRLCGTLDRLVCNQEVAGSIPVVSNPCVRGFGPV
jgi:hypothetical protein